MNLKAIAVLLLLSVCPPARSFISRSECHSEEYAKFVSKAAQDVWPKLHSVWDTDVYSTLRLIIADDKNAWAIDSKGMVSIPFSEIINRNLPYEYMYYKKIEWPDKRPTLYISMGPSLMKEEQSAFSKQGRTIPLLFNVATHEAFHYFVQQNVWKKNDENTYSTRATPYPFQAEPRIYRNSMIRALYAALRGEPHGLAHTKYWYDLWGRRHSDEVSRIRRTDIDEGTARYFELSAEIMAQGVTFGSPEFERILLSKMENIARNVYTAADSESYAIGALSAFVLDRNKVQWKQAVMNGKTPLDILMEKVRPEYQNVDADLEKKLIEYTNLENKKRKSEVDRILSAFQGSDDVKFMISKKNIGTYTLKGGVISLKNFPHDIMLGFNASAALTDGYFHIRDASAVSVIQNSETARDENVVIVYPGQLPHADKGRLRINNENLSVNVPYPANWENNRIILLN